MSKKLSIKPVHLVFIGLAIIVLGVLIPSFFISPFSTIGFSVIIGSVILLSAYAYFAVNLVRSKGKRVIKWLALPVILALLVGGGFFANYKYQQSLNDKIYAAGESIGLSDFTLTVSSPTYTTPPLNEPQEKVAAFGDINTVENCSKYNFYNEKPPLDLNDKSTWIDENDWEKAHPSGKYCEWRNDSRKKIQAYLADNKRVSIDYKITAKDTVDSKDVHVAVMLDSGRDATKQESQFDYDPLLSTKYFPAFDYTYKLYSETQLGGNINKGITRSQNVSFDVRNNEKTIDLRVTYKGQTRLVRISR
jgi:hypothetical protein